MSYGNFGIREIVDVVFRPLSSVDIGSQHFDAMQPCLYLDSAQTASLEGAATTVYAQGGQGNNRLIAWEGEKTLTLTITNALISNISFAMLSGAGVTECNEENGNKVYMHTTYELPVRKSDGKFYAELNTTDRNGDRLFISKESPVYAVTLDAAGGIKSYLSAVKLEEISVGTDFKTATALSEIGEVKVGDNDKIYFNLASSSNYVGETKEPKLVAGDVVRIDCYTVHTDGAVQIDIDANSFAGYYYIEADTLFREEATGKDFPAEFVIPRGKIQSNFTFTLAATGDPSTFDFTIDCFPAYTSFSKSKKVLCQLNIVDPDVSSHNYNDKTIHGHVERTQDADIAGYWGGSIFEEAGTDED